MAFVSICDTHNCSLSINMYFWFSAKRRSTGLTCFHIKLCSATAIHCHFRFRRPLNHVRRDCRDTYYSVESLTWLLLYRRQLLPKIDQVDWVVLLCDSTNNCGNTDETDQTRNTGPRDLHTSSGNYEEKKIHRVNIFWHVEFDDIDRKINSKL